MVNIDTVYQKVLTLANKAAGKVIGKIGTSPIILEELFDNQLRNYKNKVCTKCWYGWNGIQYKGNVECYEAVWKNML